MAFQDFKRILDKKNKYFFWVRLFNLEVLFCCYNILKYDTILFHHYYWSLNLQWIWYCGVLVVLLFGIQTLYPKKQKGFKIGIHIFNKQKKYCNYYRVFKALILITLDIQICTFAWSWLCIQLRFKKQETMIKKYQAITSSMALLNQLS